jgi:hypothetical protein
MAERTLTVLSGKPGITDRVVVRTSAALAADTSDTMEHLEWGHYDEVIVSLQSVVGSPTIAFVGDSVSASGGETVPGSDTAVTKLPTGTTFGYSRVVPRFFWVTLAGGAGIQAVITMEFIRKRP